MFHLPTLHPPGPCGGLPKRSMPTSQPRRGGVKAPRRGRWAAGGRAGGGSRRGRCWQLPPPPAPGGGRGPDGGGSGASQPRSLPWEGRASASASSASAPSSWPPPPGVRSRRRAARASGKFSRCGSSVPSEASRSPRGQVKGQPAGSWGGRRGEERRGPRGLLCPGAGRAGLTLVPLTVMSGWCRRRGLPGLARSSCGSAGHRSCLLGRPASALTSGVDGVFFVAGGMSVSLLERENALQKLEHPDTCLKATCAPSYRVGHKESQLQLVGGVAVLSAVCGQAQGHRCQCRP